MFGARTNLFKRKQHFVPTRPFEITDLFESKSQADEEWNPCSIKVTWESYWESVSSFMKIQDNKNEMMIVKEFSRVRGTK